MTASPLPPPIIWEGAGSPAHPSWCRHPSCCRHPPENAARGSGCPPKTYRHCLASSGRGPRTKAMWRLPRSHPHDRHSGSAVPCRCNSGGSPVPTPHMVQPSPERAQFAKHGSSKRRPFPIEPTRSCCLLQLPEETIRASPSRLRPRLLLGCRHPPCIVQRARAGRLRGSLRLHCPATGLQPHTHHQ